MQQRFRRADAYANAIASLFQQGYDLGAADKSKTIGVMSPFSQQANALRYRLTKCWQNFSWDDIGTVHTFQGEKKQPLSFILTSAKKSIVFGSLIGNPIYAHTAVSRARELFVLVGNIDELRRAGGETKRLVEHIEQHGDIRSKSALMTSFQHFW